MTKTSGSRSALGFIASASVLVLLAGCGSAVTPTSAGSPATSVGAGSELSGDLTILVGSAQSSDDAFKAFNEKFKAKYPNVNAVVTPVRNTEYAAAEAAQLTAGKADIVMLQDNFGDVPDYITSKSDDVLVAENGGFVDLSGQPFMKSYAPSILEVLAVQGKTFAVPLGVSYVTGLYYNKTVFAQHGLKVPTTWSEFQNVLTTLEAAGITPIGIGGKDDWPAGMVVQGVVAGLYPTTAAKKALVEGLWNGSVDLAAPPQLTVLERTKRVFEAAGTKFAGVNYDDVPSAFARGDVAMTVDGTWNHLTIEQAVNGAFEFGYFPLPASDKAEDNTLLNGKISLSLAVNALSKNQSAALAWVEMLSEPENYVDFVTTSGSSSAQPNVAQDDKFLESISQYTSTYLPMWESLWYPNPDAGDAAVFGFDYADLAPYGTMTAVEAAQAAQEAWTAGLK